MERQAELDLAICQAASPGPWLDGLDDSPPDSGIESASGGAICRIAEHGNINTVARTGEYFSHADARFVAMSREALPYWIGEALDAAAEVNRLIAVLVSEDR